MAKGTHYNKKISFIKLAQKSQLIREILNKEKTPPRSSSRHVSWLRLYAIKLDDGKFLITGGAIKLTHKMEEREHTAAELSKLERVRNFLLAESVYDSISFDDYIELDSI